MDVYESLLDVPVDEYVGDDNDDQEVPTGEVPHTPPRQLAGLAGGVHPNPNQAVPFVYVKARDRGPQVKALKRALSRAGYGTWLGSKFTGLMGPFAIRSLNRFKKAHGLSTSGSANGVYDKATWRELAPYFDAYAIKFLLGAKSPAQTREQKIRQAFLAELMYLYNRRAVERYTQGRPWDLGKPPWGLDCSASGEWAAKWTGVMKSLSGYIGWGFGNTDSQLSHFRSSGAVRSGIATADVGDPFYYGRGGDPSHVAYWIGVKNGVGLVWSFGAYPIKILPHDYRHDRIAICNLMAGQ